MSTTSSPIQWSVALAIRHHHISTSVDEVMGDLPQTSPESFMNWPQA
eukprot:CAMPEP_0172903810 /NCGR_PEP_ID=MMETSP1075-20121228/171345_1 /TAXON_ID=2916 /ORGANISM="Ceratium fusus, Strain PA161109" /LENGTH=46 /DNA_ID= /DNA_START= /DNA_END= /DNA_ORIENTATION=